MPIGSGNFGDLLNHDLQNYYGLEYQAHPEQYTEFFEIRNSTKAGEESLSSSGFGLVPTKQKGGSVSYDTAKQNWKQTLTHVTRGAGFIVERELYDDDLGNQIAKLPKALARSTRNTIEVIGANVLNNAFSNSYTGADGLELCSTAHLLGGGGTYKNELTTAADFDSTSFEQALIDIGDFVDDRGLNIAAKAVKGIFPIELAWQAAKVLGSDKVPEDANNAINPGKGVMPYVTNNFLTDPDAWFIKTNVSDGLVWYWRKRPVMTMDNDFDTENAKWKVVFRCSQGWDDPKGLFGSPGV